VLSLAIADLLVTAVTLPEVWYTIFFNNTFPWPLKLVYDVLVVASIFSLCAMTLERYIAVVHPLKYPHLIYNSRLVFFMIAVPWLIGIVTPWPYYICYRFQKLIAFRSLQVTYLFTCECLPTMVLLMAYIKMLLVVRKQENMIQQQNNQVRYNHGTASIQKNRLDKRNRSNIQAIGLILLVFALCYAVSFYKGFKNYVLFEYSSAWSVSMARILYQVNSAVNGFVYALLKKDIKEELNIIFSELLPRKLRCRNKTDIQKRRSTSHIVTNF
jgi:hypothetical protein